MAVCAALTEARRKRTVSPFLADRSCVTNGEAGYGTCSPLSASAAPYKSKSHEDCPTKDPNNPDAS
jgi:hypothetical protein